MPKNNKRWRLIFNLLLILAMALTACGGDDDDDGDNGGGGGSVTVNLAAGSTTVDVPDGWVSSGAEGDQQIWLASSDAALAKTDRGNTDPVSSGEVAALVSPRPSGVVDPSVVVDGLCLSLCESDPVQITGGSQDVTIGDFSGVRAPVGNPLAEGWGYFVTIDENYIVMVLGFTAPGEYNDDIDSTIRGIVRSVTVSPPVAVDGDG